MAGLMSKILRFILRNTCSVLYLHWTYIRLRKRWTLYLVSSTFSVNSRSGIIRCISSQYFLCSLLLLHAKFGLLTCSLLREFLCDTMYQFLPNYLNDYSNSDDVRTCCCCCYCVGTKLGFFKLWTNCYLNRELRWVRLSVNGVRTVQ